MKVLITGLTGLIGQEIGKALAKKNYEIIGLSRSPEKGQKSVPFESRFFEWDLYSGEAPLAAIEDADVIIHLAGHPIADGRWTSSTQKKILDSRILGTRHIVQSISSSKKKPKVFICASAIGIYPYSDTEKFDEDSTHGDHFLAEVCKKWEKEAREVSSVSNDIRKVQIRIGVVLSPKGGALEKMLPIAKKGILGPIGNGQQMMSWIHIDDLVNIFSEAIINEKYQGPINAVSPGAVNNKEFTSQLMNALGKKSFFPVPPIALKVAFGKMSQVLIQGQNVLPKKLNDLGFSFSFPEIKDAMEKIVEDLGSKN